MKPSEKAYEIIKMWEQLRCRAYKPLPTEKYYSIGYGHYGKDVDRNQVITPQQAVELMHQDVARYADKLNEYCPYLHQRQFDALVSFIYNVGWYAFRYSMTGVCCHSIGLKYSPTECAQRLLLWVKAGGVTLLGLQRRRVYEANYFLGTEAFAVVDGSIVVL